MVKTVTPFSTRAKEGATDSPLGDFVEVPQTITSTANAGFYDTTGKLRGIQSSDKLFVIDAPFEGIPNGATILSPQLENHEYIDMTGFNNLFFAINPSRAGNYAIEAVMAPSTYSFANLTPLNAASALRGCVPANAATPDMDLLFSDGAESLTADVWNIYVIQGQLANQKMLQFTITNNSGGNSTFSVAFMRVI